MTGSGGAPPVRSAQEADLALLPPIEVRAGERFRDIGLGAIADDDPPSVADLRSAMARGMLWVATDHDGVVVGYARASVVDGEGHLDQVSVDPSAQGTGLGRALVERVCRWARDEGFPAVTLTTFLDVEFNGPLYAHLGFAPIADDELGPGLRAIRDEERRAGLDLRPRGAMRRGTGLHPTDDTSGVSGPRPG